MKHCFLRHITEVHIKKLNLSFQSLICNRSVSSMGMFPRPEAGPLSALCQSAVLLFFRVYQSHIAVIRFRLLIQKVKDTGSSRKTHNDRVDLLRYLVDITGKLFRHIQERNDNTDPQHFSGKAYVGYVRQKKDASRHSYDYIEDISHVIEDGAQRIGVFVGCFRFMEQFFIDPVKVFLCLFFMTEHFDNLLTVHHLFHIALHMAQGFLLTDEVTGGFASHLLCDKEHTDNAGNNYQGHPQAVVNHDAEHSGNHDP